MNTIWFLKEGNLFLTADLLSMLWASFLDQNHSGMEDGGKFAL